MRHYRRSVAAGFYSNGGPCATLLAERLSEYLGGGAECIPVANCTLGLVVALRAACPAADRRRRLVLCPSYTFTATACAIAAAGLEPAFVDVEGAGWHLDCGSLERELTRHHGRVAAVLACATFGTPPPAAHRARWREIARRHGVPLLVDAAPGFGAVDENGTPLGGVGDTEVFSFHATKPFSIGEGGLIATGDRSLAQAARRLINFGLRPGSRASDAVGLNAKMSELHAAAALAMLERIDEVVACRRENAARMRDRIEPLGYRFQVGSERSTWQILHVQAPTAEVRDRCVALAPAHAIELRTMHEPPLHRQPAFAAADRGPLSVTDALCARSLALPMANRMPEDAFERIPALLEAALSP